MAKNMDAELENMKELADEQWKLLGLKDKNATAEKVIEFMNKEEFQAAAGTRGPMGENRPTPV